MQEKQKEFSELTDETSWYKRTKERISELINPDWHLSGISDNQAEKDWFDMVEQELKEIDLEIQAKEKEMRFSGPHDKASVVMTIQAGVGGTDAQDWAQMLERMYLRFAESKKWPTTLLDRSPGEEAGIKHCTFLIDGKLAYGILKEENGVHRLVRLSPFNADNLRQTSFARVEVLPQLTAKEAPSIDAKDLRIDTYRSSGAGGQHVNKTSSAVRLTHLPTGVVVQCQNERSQMQNKERAMSILQAKLQILAEQQHTAELKAIKGETKQAAWGNQIRSYVLHPYTQVKDRRTNFIRKDVKKVLDGDLTGFVPDI